MFPHVTSNIQVPFMQPQWPRARASGGGGFVPTDIAGCVLWLPADQITGLSDGDPVGTWNDQSGAGNNATQATAGFRPVFQTAEINGRPVVQFDGVDDLMTAAGGTLGQPCTVFVVGMSLGSSGTNFVGGDTPGACLSVSSTGNPGIFAGSSVISGTGSSAYHYNSGIFNGASSAIYVDGFPTFGDAGPQSFNGGFCLGSYYSAGVDRLEGSIAEVIIYDSALSSGDRMAVEAYLAAKYAL